MIILTTLNDASGMYESLAAIVQAMNTWKKINVKPKMEIAIVRRSVIVDFIYDTQSYNDMIFV